MMDTEGMEELVFKDAIQKATIFKVEILPPTWGHFCVADHTNIGVTSRITVYYVDVVATRCTCDLLKSDTSPSVSFYVGSCSSDHVYLVLCEGSRDFEAESVFLPT